MCALRSHTVAVALTIAVSWLSGGKSAEIPHGFSHTSAAADLTIHADGAASRVHVGPNSETHVFIDVGAGATTSVLVQVSSDNNRLASFGEVGSQAPQSWPGASSFTWSIPVHSGLEHMLAEGVPAGQGVLVTLATPGAADNVTLRASTLGAANPLPLEAGQVTLGLAGTAQQQSFVWTVGRNATGVSLAWAGLATAMPIGVHATTQWNGSVSTLPGPAHSGEACYWSITDGTQWLRIAPWNPCLQGASPRIVITAIPLVVPAHSDLVPWSLVAWRQDQAVRGTWGRPTLGLPTWTASGFAGLTGNATKVSYHLPRLQSISVALAGGPGRSLPSTYLLSPGLAPEDMGSAQWESGTNIGLASPVSYGLDRFNIFVPGDGPCKSAQTRFGFSTCNSTQGAWATGDWLVMLSSTQFNGAVPFSSWREQPSTPVMLTLGQHLAPPVNHPTTVAPVHFQPTCSAWTDAGTCSAPGPGSMALGRVALTVSAAAWGLAGSPDSDNVPLSVSLRGASFSGVQTELGHSNVFVEVFVSVCSSAPGPQNCTAAHAWPSNVNVSVVSHQLNFRPFKDGGDGNIPLTLPRSACAAETGHCVVYITARHMGVGGNCGQCANGMGLEVALGGPLARPLRASDCLNPNTACTLAPLDLPAGPHGAAVTLPPQTGFGVDEADIAVHVEVCRGNASLFLCSEADGACSPGVFQRPWAGQTPALVVNATLPTPGSEQGGTVGRFTFPRSSGGVVIGGQSTGAGAASVQIVLRDDAPASAPLEFSSQSARRVRVSGIANTQRGRSIVSFACQYDVQVSSIGSTRLYMYRWEDVRADDVLTTGCGFRAAWNSHLWRNGAWSAGSNSFVCGTSTQSVEVVGTLQQGVQYGATVVTTCGAGTACSTSQQALQRAVSLPAVYTWPLPSASPAPPAKLKPRKSTIGAGGIVGVTFGIIGMCAMMGFVLGWLSRTKRSSGAASADAPRAPLLAQGSGV